MVPTCSCVFLCFPTFSYVVLSVVTLFNFLIVQAAFKEGHLKSYIEYFVVAILGTVTFILFEIFGPIIIGLAIIFCVFYFFWHNNKLVADLT